MVFGACYKYRLFRAAFRGTVRWLDNVIIGDVIILVPSVAPHNANKVFLL